MRIEKDSNGAGTTIRLIGHFRRHHIDELTRHLDGEPVLTVLDLCEVTLVDREIIGFLVQCEAQGSRIENCPLYIRQWMTLEQSE